MSSHEVYVVTLQLDSRSFEWLQKLRTQHFPPHRNLLPAHLTLLHAVSLDQVNRLKQHCEKFARMTSPLIRFTGLRSLGGGTAVVADAPGVSSIRHEMMQMMAGVFSRQDQQPFKAHVTVQNKVDPTTARALLEQLATKFVAREGTGTGLMLWRYWDGPWSLDTIFSFDKAVANGEDGAPSSQMTT